MIILTLDLGSNVGWALYNADNEQVISSNTQKFKAGKFDSPNKRWHDFGIWLKEIKQQYGEINSVYFEQVDFLSSRSTAWPHFYGGLLAKLFDFCEHHNIMYSGVSVGTIKKHITGKGNAGKEQVIAAIRALGHAPCDDNEADALALMHYALDQEELLVI